MADQQRHLEPVAVLTKTELGEASAYRNMTTFLVEKEPGSGEIGEGQGVQFRLAATATESRPPTR